MEGAGLMERKPEFRYYYGNEAEQYSFFKIPKLLITHKYFKDLSSDAKILYGLLLDRMSLSVKNKWFDEENRAYISFSIEEIAETLSCSRGKAVKTLQELDTEKGIGLIEKRRLGQGNNTIIYVKSFLIQQEIISQQSNAEYSIVSEVQNLEFLNSKNRNSRSTKNEILEVQNLDSSNTKYNKTDINNTNSNHIVSITDREKERYDERYDTNAHKAYRELIKDNIDFDSLLEVYPAEKESIQGIFDLIIEIVMSSNEKFLIASSWYPASLVKSKFLKLNYLHIEYVLERLKTNTTKVRNIKKYILAALFNAPSTMDGYYRAEVNHDMPQYVAK